VGKKCRSRNKMQISYLERYNKIKALAEIFNKIKIFFHIKIVASPVK
jgi:hypothetical protein